MTTRREPTLSAEQLTELLGLIKGADSVELKISIPDSDRRSVVAALGMDPLDVQARQVCFFDTPDLLLNRSGLVVRARRIQNKPGDSVIKLRPVLPDTLTPELRKTPGFGVEVDAMPGGFICSASMKAEVDSAVLKNAFAGHHPARKLFTKAQRAFYHAHAPEGLGIDDLNRLGPINVFKLRFTPAEFGRKMVAEMWFYPDGSRVLELSTKCLPSEAFHVGAETKAFLVNNGVSLSAEQQTKTKTALEFFANELTGTSA